MKTKNCYVIGLDFGQNYISYKKEARSGNEVSASHGHINESADVGQFLSDLKNDKTAENHFIFILFYRPQQKLYQNRQDEAIEKLINDFKDKTSEFFLMHALEESALPPVLLNEVFQSNIQRMEPLDCCQLKRLMNQKVAKMFEDATRTTQLSFNIEQLEGRLDDLQNKAALLKDEKAALAATTLATTLKACLKPFANEPTPDNYRAFKTIATLALNEAHLELDKHRGWKRLLSNLGLFILGLGVFYGIAVLMNNGNLFFNKTDSAEKLDAIEQTMGLLAPLSA